MINQFDRLACIPDGAYYLVQIIELGLQGSETSYKDEILVWTMDREELERYCVEQGYQSSMSGSWSYRFIHQKPNGD